MPVRSLIQPVVAGLGDVEPLVFSQGEELALDEASHRLVENAYTRVDLVMDRGEFAVRGGIIDVFPPTLPHPVRIEFFGDEIDTIKNSMHPTSVRMAVTFRWSGPRHAVSCS